MDIVMKDSFTGLPCLRRINGLHLVFDANSLYIARYLAARKPASKAYSMYIDGTTYTFIHSLDFVPKQPKND